ncbi:hypothetical protein VYU27_003374 [Nannochloropsis oceanica]
MTDVASPTPNTDAVAGAPVSVPGTTPTKATTATASFGMNPRAGAFTPSNTPIKPSASSSNSSSGSTQPTASIPSSSLPAAAVASTPGPPPALATAGVGAVAGGGSVGIPAVTKPSASPLTFGTTSSSSSSFPSHTTSPFGGPPRPSFGLGGSASGVTSASSSSGTDSATPAPTARSTQPPFGSGTTFGSGFRLGTGGVGAGGRAVGATFGAFGSIPASASPSMFTPSSLAGTSLGTTTTTAVPAATTPAAAPVSAPAPAGDDSDSTGGSSRGGGGGGGGGGGKAVAQTLADKMAQRAARFGQAASTLPVEEGKAEKEGREGDEQQQQQQRGEEGGDSAEKGGNA